MLNNFLGMDGFVWWFGVVEDRFDPLQVGRMKVRVYGFHKEDKSEQPTEDLPWAYPIIPIDSGRMNTTGIREGARVVGFFIDGPHGQQPIVIGLVPGFPEKEADPSVGFNDPRPDSLLEGHQVPREPKELEQHDDGSGNDITEQPKKSRFPDKDFLPEPDTSRYARGRDGGFIDKTVVPLKIENVGIGQTDVPTGEHTPGTGTDVASPQTKWTEEPTHYDAKYPYNNAYFAEGGHIIEVDNTPGKERLHWYHRVGTFREINEVGLQVDKIVDKHYDIVLRSRHTHIEAFYELTVDWYAKMYVNKDKKAGFNFDLTVGAGGNYNVTTEDGKVNVYSNGDINVYTTGSAYVETDEDVVLMVHGNVHGTVDKNVNLHVKQDVNLKVDGSVRAKVDGDVTAQIGGDLTTFVAGDKHEYIAGNYSRYVGGETNIFCASSINHNAVANIRQNAGASISHTATASVTNTAAEVQNKATHVTNVAATEVLNVAPVVTNMAAATNCTGLLTGMTIDDSGDATLPGPASAFLPMTPPFSFTEILAIIEDVAEALVVDIVDNAEDIINDALEDALTDAEAQAEADAAAAASNSAAAGSGSGGPKGPSIFVDGPGGFLWKPTGDNSGVVTILWAGEGGVAIYRAVIEGEEDVSEEVTKDDGTTETKVTKKPKYSKGALIETCPFVKTFLDGRGIHRGSRPGAAYGPEPVVCTTGGGEYLIEHPEMRYD